MKGMELTKAKSILVKELTDGKSKKPIMGMELTEIKPIVGIKLRNKRNPSCESMRIEIQNPLWRLNGNHTK